MRKFHLLSIFLAPLLIYAQSYNCLDCHTQHGLTKYINDTTEVSLFVNQQELRSSVHADLECTDCHAVSDKHPDEQSVGEPTCSNCHESEQEEYHSSVHSQAFNSGNKTAANCWSCHGSHNILAKEDNASMANKANLLETCGFCHSKPEVMRHFGRRELDLVAAFKESIHGKIFMDDPEAPVANCIACHGSHAILAATEPNAKLNKFNIPKTCGTCHEQEEKDYYQSIHWKSLKRGHYESPVCTDCHGEHNINLAEGKNSPTNPVLQSTKLCASCHSSPPLMSKFGLDAKRMDSYMKTYHGLAVLKGSPEAATCTSCHEMHAIRSSRDSLSSVHSSNLIQTCGQCHSDISESFAAINVHPVNLAGRNPVAYFFRVSYKWLIIMVIGGMLVHNIIIMFYYIRRKRRVEKNEISYQRFQSWEVYQHFLLFLSFALLGITGFALKFPDAAWVQLLVNLGMDEAVRSVIHRIAAVILAVISIIQFVNFVVSNKGRKDFISILPTRDDIIHVWQNMRFYLGYSKTHPEFGRYDYAAKAEYLALIWGNIVMGVTGFTLWFPEIIMKYLPAWAFETMEVVHYFEAWLAVLAILVWHLFFVIFHPEKYPMEFIWMDGKITTEDLKRHHPAEYKKLQESKEE